MKSISFEFIHLCPEHGGTDYSGIIRPCKVCGKLCNTGVLKVTELNENR